MRKILSFTAFLAGASLFAAPVAAQTPLRVGYIPVLGTAQIFIAEQQGWLKEAGLDVKFTTFESGPNMISALASGTLDVYVAGVAPLAVARSKGVDVKVVASTAIDEMTVIVGGKLAEGFKPGANTAQVFKDFKAANGKPARLATQPPGSVPHTTLNHWLYEVSKVEKSDVEVLSMGIDATQQALLAGAVDGSTLREPAVTVSLQRDSKLKLVALGGQMFPKQPGTVVGVSGAFLTKNPDSVQKLVDAIVKATALIKSDPKTASVAVEKALGKGLVDNATFLKALTSPASTFVADPLAITESTKAMQTYQVKIGTLDKEIPLDGLFDGAFYAKATAKK